MQKEALKRAVQVRGVFQFEGHIYVKDEAIKTLLRSSGVECKPTLDMKPGTSSVNKEQLYAAAGHEAFTSLFSQTQIS